MRAPPSFVFLLGHPGSGKSAVYRILSERLRAKGLASDAMASTTSPYSWSCSTSDVGFKRHCQNKGGFVVTDFTILGDVLKEINRKLKELEQPGRVTFVEFAATDMPMRSRISTAKCWTTR